MDRAAKNLALLKNFDDHLRKLQELLAPPKTGAPASYGSIPVVETVALIQSDFQQGARALLARRGTASAEQLDGLVEEIARANDGSDRPLADLRKLISGVIGAPKPGTNDDSASVRPQPAAADERSSPRVALGGKGNVYLERRNGVVAPQRRFDIALSFPGERRTFVESVARSLGRTVGPKRVLYDRDYEAEFARLDLDIYLQHLYLDESFLIAVFLCADYERKDWCRLEWRAVRDLIKRREASAVMPLRFDMTEIPGLFSHDGYVWIGERTPEQVAALILERLSIIRSDPGPPRNGPETGGLIGTGLQGLVEKDKDYGTRFVENELPEADVGGARLPVLAPRETEWPASASRPENDPQDDRRDGQSGRQTKGQLTRFGPRMPLSDTGRQLLTSLLSQKSLDVQKRHAEREGSATRRAAGNLNGYALPAALLDVHAETMREFGQSVLSAHQETFEADHRVPDEHDVQEITEQIARTLDYRRQAATSEFGRLQMRIGRELPPGLLSELARRQEQMLSNLRREVEIWQLKRQLALQAGTPDSPAGAPHVTANVHGFYHQVAVAGRDQTGTTQSAVLQAAPGEALTEEEKELLRAAARKGEFFVLPTDQRETMLIVEKRSFADQADPAVAARYLGALERLKRRGLVQFDGDHLYVLTDLGFETARAL